MQGRPIDTGLGVIVGTDRPGGPGKLTSAGRTCAAHTGTADFAFLERVFDKLLLNFTWWVNRKDAQGRHIFGGGFLGMDNIGIFDRSRPLPNGSTLEQAITRERLMPAEEEKWFVFLEERHSEADFDLALDRLSRDGDYRHRIVAALVLTNFGQRDSAWRALVGGLRDANEIVRVVCAEALLSLANYTPRKVDWSSSTADLNLLLSGTNLFAYAWVIQILIETEVSPKLARPLLKDEAGELLLAYLNASHNHEREIAHDLLAQLSGRDFGFDGRRWREWVATVQT